jgi:hypothetical protein
MINQLLRYGALVLVVGLSGIAHADFDEDYEIKQWQELAVQLPAAPKDETLVSFYVSPASDSRFLIDTATVSVGSDGVVRYVLVIDAAGGARNVSYEGMRCESRERRIYASGRRDGGWSKSRNNEWIRIQDANMNRQHAALFLEYFCPEGTIVRDLSEALMALRQGGHPATKRY